jgi:acetyl-CoA synthetase
MNIKNNIYWRNRAKDIFWFKKPKIVLKKTRDNYIFYSDGTTNVAYNCIENNINKGLKNKTAIIFFDKYYKHYNLTYGHLKNLCNYFIFHLKKKIKNINLKKEIIAIHSSANLCSAITMLTCAKLGLTHAVLFDDLPKEAIKVRLKLLKCKILITSTDDENYLLKIKPLEKELGLKVIRFKRSNKKEDPFTFENFLKNKNFKKENYNYKEINSNKALFVLFTSGSTGIPKGVIHSSGGYLLYSKVTCQKQFGIEKKTIILTASDAGWINGHTYALYGPLSLGATTIILEKPLDLLRTKIIRKILMNLKVNILYLPVTLIRLMKGTFQKKLYSKYLKVLGSMGEPLSRHVAIWFGKAFSKRYLPIINTYFQTETGAIIASPKFNYKKKFKSYGTVGEPLGKFLNIFLEKKNKEIKVGSPWPGCMIKIINGKKIWNSYFDKKRNFKLFDHGEFDKQKNLIVHGRIDDVINIRGHRVGSGEIESLLLKNKKIKEACAIAVDDEIEAKKIIIFVSLNKIISKNIIENIIINNFGTFLKPKSIFIIPELPKTRSGKILRRVLRQIYLNPNINNLGDLSTVLDKNILLIIKKIVKNEEDRRK